MKIIKHGLYATVKSGTAGLTCETNPQRNPPLPCTDWLGRL